MLRLFLFRFWPVLIPLVIYGLWFRRAARKASINGKPVIRFRDTPWYWAVLSSLLLAVGCFIFLSMSRVEDKGVYTPPHMQNGALVPAQVSKP